MYQDPELLLREDIFTEWKEEYSDLFSKHTLLLQHRMHELPHFRRENLASLIEKAPSAVGDLVRPGPVGTKRYEWRRGTIKGVSGEEVLTAIDRGRFWISLQALETWNEDYARLSAKIFKDISTKVPGFQSFKHKTGMLISSPGAQVYYHCDIPGQSLWQIQGKKSVYIYPNTEPFLKDEQLESVFLGVTEEEIEYQSWFDDYAEKIVLEPGQMAHWPLNGPHRVENHDVVNISLTTEHFTKEIRDFYAIIYANGLLRRMGISPSRHSIGARKYAKFAIAAGNKLVYRKLFAKISPKAAQDFKLNLSKPDYFEDI